MNSVAPLQPALVFPDLQSGAAFLHQLPLANPLQAQGELLRFLDSLLAAPPDALSTLSLLERAQVPLAFAQDATAKKYLNRPLPLGDQEEAALGSVIRGWKQMADAYAACAAGLAEGEDTPQRLALILHRCLHYTGLIMAEHYRARRELTPNLWLDLHGYYDSAEEWGVATLPVPDPLAPLEGKTHCAAAFVGALLLELAAPYNLSVRSQELAQRWANQWAPLVTVHPVLAEEASPSLAVDLMQDGGLKPTAGRQGSQLRCLDTSRLTLQVQQVHAQLKQRVAPVDAGLGEGCSTSQCVRLLATLLRPWSQRAVVRRFRRLAAAGTARVCVGWEAIHYFVAGVEFAQPENVRLYSREEFERLYVFRHQVDPTRELAVAQAQLDYAWDEWQVDNQSPAGYRLRRRAMGQPMLHGQLLAILPPGGSHPMLAQTSWLMQEGSGHLVAGIAVMAGQPQAVATRLAGPLASPSESYGRAFLLPAVSSLEAVASLILPPGWYGSQREVEIYAETPRRVRLEKVLQSGPDFERVSFVVCTETTPTNAGRPTA